MASTLMQGSGRILNIPIVEQGSPINVTTALGIIVCLISAKTGREMAKYSLNPIAGYGDLTVNANNVSVDVEIEGSDSAGFDVGAVKAVITYKMPDPAFSDGDNDFKFASSVLIMLKGDCLDETP